MRRVQPFTYLVPFIAVLALAGCGEKAPPASSAPAEPAGPPPTPTVEQLRVATVSGVFAAPVTLAGGVYEGEPAEPGASSRPRLQLWESSVHFGDMDGAAGSEAVAMLSSNAGGSGEFVHVAVFGVRDGALANLGTAAVGDRTKLQSLWLERGKVLMDVIEVGPNDAACCPTQVARKTYGLEGGEFKQLSSEVRGVLAISSSTSCDSSRCLSRHCRTIDAPEGRVSTRHGHTSGRQGCPDLLGCRVADRRAHGAAHFLELRGRSAERVLGADQEIHCRLHTRHQEFGRHRLGGGTGCALDGD